MVTSYLFKHIKTLFTVCLISLIVVGFSAVSFAQEESNPCPDGFNPIFIEPGDDLQQIESGQKYDCFVLKEGLHYLLNKIHFHNDEGPIRIQGEGNHQSRLMGTGCDMNMFEIDGSTEITISNLYMTLADVFIRFGYGFGGTVNKRHVVEDNVFFEACNNAITASKTRIEDSEFRGNYFLNTGKPTVGSYGESIYLGSNDGLVSGSIAIGNEIEHNTVLITHNNSIQGDGIELKPGSTDNEVRNNIIYGTHYPAITTYSGGSNLIIGNFVWMNLNNHVDHAMDLGGGPILNNVIFNSKNDGIRIKGKVGPAEPAIVIQNTVVNAKKVGINFINAKGTTVLANNISVNNGTDYAFTGDNNIVASNYYKDSFSGFLDGSGFVKSGPISKIFKNLTPKPGELNLSLKEGWKGIDSGDPAYSLPIDALGVPRPQGGGVDPGALEYQSSESLLFRAKQLKAMLMEYK